MGHEEWHLAINLLRAATYKDSRNFKLLDLLCECLEKVGSWDELLQVQKAIVKFNVTFDTIYHLANTHYKLGQDDHALRCYFECLALMKCDPEKLFEVYKNLGNIFVRQKDFEGAEEYYNRAYVLDRQADMVLVNFGTLEVQRENYDRALECFRQAIEINSQNDRAWIGLALVHNYFGDHDLAWGNIERAIDISSKNPTSLQIYATWGLQRQRIERPMEILMNVIHEIESSTTLFLLLIQMLIQSEKFQLARLEAERAFLLDPMNEELARMIPHLKEMAMK